VAVWTKPTIPLGRTRIFRELRTVEILPTSIDVPGKKSMRTLIPYFIFFAYS